MKRRTEKETPILLRISMIVFIVLLAVYIPLRIYISHSGPSRLKREKIDFTIFVTHNISSPAETRKHGYNYDRYPDRQKGDGLLVELCGIGCYTAEDRYSDFIDFTKAAENLRYDAVAVDLSRNMDYFLKLIESGYSHIPFTSVNIIDDDGKTIFRRWIIKEIKGKNPETDETAEVKTGIFSVAFDREDSDYTTVRRYKTIDPRIASLEATTRMENENCALVVALSRVSSEKSIDLARSVPGIDLVINLSEPGTRARLRSTGNSYIFDIPEGSSSLQKLNIKLDQDSLNVLLSRQR
ncbi:MAG TPA: hypothetical protein VKO43_03790 [Candidatus Krumholzibacteriaceae bacterium]|nr:hypothetical protein [Candidatus Krumholzibacteriaceae bacterium]